jgi:hypothetical protein
LPDAGRRRNDRCLNDCRRYNDRTWDNNRRNGIAAGAIPLLLVVAAATVAGLGYLIVSLGYPAEARLA